MKKLIRLGVLSIASLIVGAASTGCTPISNWTNTEVVLPNATMTMAEFDAAYTPTAPLEINFWTGFGSAVSAVIDSGISEFEAAYPNIVITHTSKGGYDNLQKAINLSITSETYPNVAIGYPDHFAGYINSSIQYALDPFIENTEYGTDLTDYISDYMKENQTFQFKDEAKTQGYTLGLPFNKSTEVMVYNKTFFTWATSKDATIAVPSTWDDVATMGGKVIDLLTNGGYFGHKIDATGTLNDSATGLNVLIDLTGITAENFYPFSYDSQSNFFISAVRQWGGVYTEMGEDISQGYALFNNPNTVEALTFLKGLYTDHILGVPATWGETSYCSVPFKATKSIMTISSSAGVYNNVPSGDAFEIGISTVPFHSTENQSVISQGTNMAIFKTSDDAKALASWLFVKYMTNTWNSQFAIESGYFPVTYSGLNSTAYQNYINTTEDSSSNLSKIHAALVNFESYSNTESGWTKFVDPGFVGSSTIREQAGYIIPMLFYGDAGTMYSEQQVLDYAMSQLGDYVKPTA